MGYSIEQPFGIPPDLLTAQLSPGARFAYGLEASKPDDIKVAPVLIHASRPEGPWVAVASTTRAREVVQLGQIRFDIPTPYHRVLPAAEEWIRDSPTVEIVAGRILQVRMMRLVRTDRLALCGLLVVRAGGARV